MCKNQYAKVVGISPGFQKGMMTVSIHACKHGEGITYKCYRTYRRGASISEINSDIEQLSGYADTHYKRIENEEMPAPCKTCGGWPEIRFHINKKLYNLICCSISSISSSGYLVALDDWNNKMKGEGE